MIRICTLIFLAITLNAGAHPGVGIVRDSKGNIYYTDLGKVWRLSADGEKTVALDNIHTHELFIDKADRLFGEHLWYNGEAKNTWGHYTWRLNPDGKLDTIIKPKEGFPENYSFVRDEYGNMYIIERGDTTKFQMLNPSGIKKTLGVGKFKDVRWMTYVNGYLLFIDLLDLYRLDKDGKFTLLAKNISKTTVAFAAFAGKHSLLGIWTDKLQNIYVANYSGQCVRKVTPSGAVTSIAYSIAPWAPSGGLFDDKGNLWLLEYSVANKVRVRKISTKDLESESPVKSILINDVLIILVLLAITIGIIILGRRLFGKKRTYNYT